MEDLMRAYDILGEITPVTNRLSKDSFGALCCMLLEEWCAGNDEDIVKYIEDLADAVREVNTEFGKYPG